MVMMVFKNAVMLMGSICPKIALSVNKLGPCLGSSERDRNHRASSQRQKSLEVVWKKCQLCFCFP